MQRWFWKDDRREIGRRVLIALERREWVECVYKVCKSLTSPFRAFNILPNPEEVSQERFNFLFPLSLSRCYDSAHSKAHTCTLFWANVWPIHWGFYSQLDRMLAWGGLHHEFCLSSDWVWHAQRETIISYRYDLMLSKYREMKSVWMERFPLQWTQQSFGMRSFISFKVCF